MSLQIISLLLLFFLAIYLYIVFFHIDFNNNTFNNLITPSQTVGTLNRVDCTQQTTYCFENSHCRSKCLDTTGSICRNGICLSSNVLNTQAPINTCDASRGVVTFLVGNTALGRFDTLCRSIDPGIAPNDVTQPNRMCFMGNIDIDYTKKFPSINDCWCPYEKYKIIIPATREIRPYAICMNNPYASRIL